MSTTSTASSSPRSAAGADELAAPSTPAAVRDALEAAGVRPSRSWGQSFLLDPYVADAEAALAAPRPGGRVLEIGGGLGQLTAALLRRGVRSLRVVEKDRRLATHLRRTFGGRVEVLRGDALEADLPDADVVVGNLPYATATPILLRLFARRVPRVVFLVQEEVAQRLAADPGGKNYGRLSLVARLYGSVELFREVPPTAFWPEPEVRSRLGVHTARPGPLPVADLPVFESTVRTLFSSRRKQLGNLVPRLERDPRRAEELVRRAGWPADWRTRRPENLPPEAFFRLAVLRSGSPLSPNGGESSG